MIMVSKIVADKFVGDSISMKSTVLIEKMLMEGVSKRNKILTTYQNS